MLLYVRIESGSGEVGGCVPESAGEDTRTRDQDGGRENQNDTGLPALSNSYVMFQGSVQAIAAR